MKNFIKTTVIVFATGAAFSFVFPLATLLLYAWAIIAPLVVIVRERKKLLADDYILGREPLEEKLRFLVRMVWKVGFMTVVATTALFFAVDSLGPGFCKSDCYGILVVYIFVLLLPILYLLYRPILNLVAFVGVVFPKVDAVPSAGVARQIISRSLWTLFLVIFLPTFVWVAFSVSYRSCSDFGGWTAFMDEVSMLDRPVSCYVEQPSLCRNSDCFRNVAEHNRNINFCENVDWSHKQSCYVVAGYELARSKGVVGCKNIPEEYSNERDSCVRTLAAQKKDLSLCQEVSSDYARDECVRGVAINICWGERGEARDLCMGELVGQGN